MKTAYDAYMKTNDISDFDALDNSNAQGYSSDYDYRVRTKQGVIYVR